MAMRLEAVLKIARLLSRIVLTWICVENGSIFGLKLHFTTRQVWQNIQSYKTELEVAA